MKDPELLIIHISDIHIANSTQPVLSRAREIAKAVRLELPATEHILIAVTGDVAFSGKHHQYEAATNFFIDIQDEFRAAFGLTPHLVVVPGNHDADFDDEAQPLRRHLIESQRKEPENSAPAVVDHCCKIFEDFDHFQGAVETMRPVEFTRLWRRYELDIGSKKISIHAINNAWSCEKRLEPGTLSFPTEQHIGMATAQADLRLALLHCPPHWLNQSIYRDFRTLVRDCSDLVLTGHEHQANAGNLNDLEAGKTAFAEAGSLQDEQGRSEFTVLGVMIDSGRFFTKHFKFEDGQYVPTGPVGEERELDLPQGNGNGFKFEGDWKNKLNDIGATITHRAKTRIELLDLFVFPDLRVENDDVDGPSIISSRELIKLHADHRAVIIKGEQGIGKSALLRAYALMLRDRGFAPIIVNGAAIKSASARDLGRLIKDLSRQQYGEGQLSAIERLQNDQRVLLLDNIDRFAFPERYFGSVIEFLRGSFGWVIATADTFFDFRAAVHTDTYKVLHEFDSYALAPLGVRTRFELVRKWYQVNKPESRADEELIVKQMSVAEKALSSVVGRGLVPAFPIYMLVLLQGFEAGRTGELENSALGAYYQYLLAQSLLGHVSQDQIQGIFNYCAHFAWYLKSVDRQSVGERQVREFHASFERLYDLDIAFADRLELLIKSRIWVDSGGEIGYRYPYSYYFFLGSYMAGRLTRGDQEVDEIVRSAVNALHVRENANMLLFVAHHTQDTYVMRLVEQSLSVLFADSVPVRFEEDTEELNRTVDALPKHIYDEKIAETKRTEILEHEASVAENMDDASYTNGTTPLATEALRMISDLNALFKGIEILGAALKNGADFVESQEKQRHLDAIFTGGLRGVKALFDKLTSSPDYLLSEMEEVIQKKKPETLTDKKKLASQAVFFFLSSLAYLFIRRMGTAVGSRALRPALARYVDEHPTMANRLVNLSCALETPGPLPLAEVKELNQRLNGHVFAGNILRQLALSRVYLYYTEAMERQQLCDELDIEMKTQRAIDYQSKDMKKVKKPS